MVRTCARRAAALVLLALAPCLVAACGTPAGASTGSIVIEPSTCLAGVSPYVTLGRDGQPVLIERIQLGVPRRIVVDPGTYIVSDGPLVQHVRVLAGTVLHVSLLPVCSPRMS